MKAVLIIAILALAAYFFVANNQPSQPTPPLVPVTADGRLAKDSFWDRLKTGNTSGVAGAVIDKIVPGAGKYADAYLDGLDKATGNSITDKDPTGILDLQHAWVDIYTGRFDKIDDDVKDGASKLVSDVEAIGSDIGSGAKTVYNKLKFW